jgi:glycerol-3-phosphate dehydrogenase
MLRLAAEDFDVLVVGGGITGCGVALDAATRGLRTALVEADDFASGTSSKSSKLIHGGLRYLQQHDYRLVYEALHERQRLLGNAPHLVHPLPFLIPLAGRNGVVVKGVAKAYSVALWLYDLTGGLRIGKRHRRIDTAEALAHFPDLRTDRLAAAFLYWDAQADDARLTLAVARTAAAHGAVVANHARVTRLVDDGDRLTGVQLADGTEIRADVIVNAGGVWSEQIADLTATPTAGAVSLRPAKGIHVTVPADRLPCDFAAALPAPGDQRTVFVVPWEASESAAPGPASGQFTYIGTTDTDYDGPLDAPVCTPEDVNYLLGTVNAWTTSGLTPADVTGAWAGLRPLLTDGRNARTRDLSRRHAVMVSANGLITVTGGKLTTYRRMAADTVDVVASRFVGRRLPSSRTRRLRLVGAGPSPVPAHSRSPVPAGSRSPVSNPSANSSPSPTSHPSAASHPSAGPSTWPGVTAGVDPATRAHLESRFGTETPFLLVLCQEDASLAEPLVAGLPYLRAEAIWAARHEMAVTLIDVLARRTRALILDREATARGAPAVAALLASELGWDEAEQARQVADLEDLIEAERRAADPIPVDDPLHPATPATPLHPATPARSARSARS